MPLRDRAILIWVAHTVTWDCADLCWSWSMLLKKARMVYVAWAASEVHVYVHGLCYPWRPSWGLWHVLMQRSWGFSRTTLLPETMSLSILCAPTGCKGQRSYFVQELMSIVSKLRERHIEGFCDNSYPHPTPTPTPPKSNSLDWKPSKRTFNVFHKDAEVVSVEGKEVG